MTQIYLPAALMGVRTHPRNKETSHIILKEQNFKKRFSKSSHSNKCQSWETCGLCDSPHHVSEPAPQARCSTGLLYVCSMCAHCSTGLNTTSTKHLQNRLASSFLLIFFFLPKLGWKSTGLWQELVHLGLHKVSSELRGDRFLSKVILAVV